MSTEHHPSTDKPIVIVGGGVTGLVTAHLLLERGQKVILVEKLSTLGGLAAHLNMIMGTSLTVVHIDLMWVIQTSKPMWSAFSKEDSTYFPRKSEVYFKGKYYGWPIKLKNLLQLAKDIAFRATIDLALNGFKEYPEDSFKRIFCVNMDRRSTSISLKDTHSNCLEIHPQVYPLRLGKGWNQQSHHQ